MVSYLFIILSTIFYVGYCQNDNKNKKTGPYYIPDWEIPVFKDHKDIGASDVLMYKDSIQAHLFSSRSWRFVQSWQMLNKHYPEINTYVIVPSPSEAGEWVKRWKCKVGTTYETKRDDDCYKDLDNQVLDKWIEPRVLKMTPPATRPYMSTCSIYYSCDIHEVSFPIYIDSKEFRPFISGPHGENIDVSGDGSVKVIKMEDSFLVFNSIQKEVSSYRAQAECLWQGDSDKGAKLYCNYNIEESQYTIVFGENQKKTVFNNFVFYRPEFPEKAPRVLKNDADPATKGDLKELENKVLLANKNLLVQNHELLMELANLKHIIRNLVLSAAKIDDNLIGKITRIPVKTKWLSDDVFILTSSTEAIVHGSSSAKNTSCLGSYVYLNGRWKIATEHERECSNWNNTYPLQIMENRITSPLEILNAPEYRNASDEYSGWTFLDDGKAGLDWMDKGLKYYDKGHGLDFNLGGLNILQILMMVAYVIIAVIAISLIISIIKMFK